MGDCKFLSQLFDKRYFLSSKPPLYSLLAVIKSENLSRTPERPVLQNRDIGVH